MRHDLPVFIPQIFLEFIPCARSCTDARGHSHAEFLSQMIEFLNLTWKPLLLDFECTHVQALLSWILFQTHVQLDLPPEQLGRSLEIWVELGSSPWQGQAK